MGSRLERYYQRKRDEFLRYCGTKLAEKLAGQQPVTAYNGPVFRVDREGNCIKPERKIVLKGARPDA